MNGKIYTTAIVGGGAAGLMLAATLCEKQSNIAIFERGERVGRKLSATGNGQGNITNLACEKEEYCSSTPFGAAKAQDIIRAFGKDSLTSFFEKLGVLLLADDRGRVYPASRQASALTDALRFFVQEKGVTTHLGTQITRVEKQEGAFLLTTDNGETYSAENLVLCTGGKAAKNFGTDGSAYALATGFGHTLTPLYPSLVQLKTDTKNTKTLKGIRVADACVSARWQGGAQTLTGDIIFTDYGVSGDAVFRLSAYIADKIERGVTLTIDFLPVFSFERILTLLIEKRNCFPDMPHSELLCGVVNNQIGRAVMKLVSEGDLARAATLVKAFPLTVTGTLGFDYAQVTKGGIPLEETDNALQSKFVDGLYFAGEILDIDGHCGGFNLQWAYASSQAVAAAIIAKARG